MTGILGRAARSSLGVGLGFAALATAPVISPAGAAGQGEYCTQTAEAVFSSCRLEVGADYSLARAICINVSDPAARARCFAEANASRLEASHLCDEQRDERKKVCESVGEARYDPEFDPALFDPDFTNPTNPNPYFPLRIGNRWDYREAGGTESNTIEVLNRTKLIEGVTCIVAGDRVTDDGELTEDTDDWYAQATNGDVYYCGEEVKNYESFEGDRPSTPELVNNDGSFKWGRNGGKGGVFFRGSPAKGEVYREEMSLTNAEDIAEVLSTGYGFGDDLELDRFVPPPLAELLCSGDCVVTKNYQPTEPGVFARKYYARGIGFFLEVNPETGKVVQLVDCNFDPRCGALPTP